MPSGLGTPLERLSPEQALEMTGQIGAGLPLFNDLGI